MKLPSISKSVWLESGRRLTFPRLSKDLNVDVAVIGAGITGLTAAFLLKRASLTVAVIEADQVASGVSGHTTAHITEAQDRSYGQLITDFGEENARLAADSTRAALKKIASLVREQEIDCDFTRLPAFWYAEKEESAPDFEAERAAAALLGVKVTLTRSIPLPFTVARGLRYDNQAQFHPRRYLMHLAAAIKGGGGHIFEGSRVVEIEPGEPCRVVTESGVVSARDVIVATHAPFNKLLLQTKIASYRSYVLALRMKPSETPPPGLFWDTEEPYHYIRSHTSAEGPLVIVGGEDHKTGQVDNTMERFDSLLEFASKRFKVASVLNRWSSQVIEPVDGLPFIGKDVSAPHVYVATGYSGTGMTGGTLAAMINTDLILGRVNPYESLYDPCRFKPKASIVDYVKENSDFPVELLKGRLKGAGAESLAEVARGEGKIMDLAGEKTAVFRDEHGLLHAVSAVCTHMGCLVRFNNGEKSWDCPCHGSRFDHDGKILNGPATTPLACRKSEAIVRDQTPPDPEKRVRKPAPARAAVRKILAKAS